MFGIEVLSHFSWTCSFNVCPNFLGLASLILFYVDTNPAFFWVIVLFPPLKFFMTAHLLDHSHLYAHILFNLVRSIDQHFGQGFKIYDKIALVAQSHSISGMSRVKRGSPNYKTFSMCLFHRGRPHVDNIRSYLRATI